MRNYYICVIILDNTTDVVIRYHRKQKVVIPEKTVDKVSRPNQRSFLFMLYN